MREKLALAAAAIALTIGGCSVLQPSQPISTTTRVDLQKGAYTAKLAFQAALTGAVFYIELPRCGRPTSPAACSQQEVVDVMRHSLITADEGTKAAEEAARSITIDTTTLGLAVNAAEIAVKALVAITPPKK